MVAILNLLPINIILIFIGLIVLFYEQRRYKLAIVTLILGCGLVYITHAITPSYIPKGTIQPLTLPEFEQTIIPSENRLLTPTLNEQERQERFDNTFDAVQRTRKENEH